MSRRSDPACAASTGGSWCRCTRRKARSAPIANRAHSLVNAPTESRPVANNPASLASLRFPSRVSTAKPLYSQAAVLDCASHLIGHCCSRFYRIESEEADASTTLAVPSIMTLHHSTDARLRPTSRGPYQSARSGYPGPHPAMPSQCRANAEPRHRLTDFLAWSGMHGWVSMAMWPTTLGNPCAKGSDA